jgi:hypothetical protein
MAQILPKFTIKPGYRPQSQDTTPKVQGDSLDTVYLNNQAKSLDLVEDLNRALIEAGLEEISAKTSALNSELG